MTCLGPPVYRRTAYAEAPFVFSALGANFAALGFKNLSKVHQGVLFLMGRLKKLAPQSEPLNDISKVWQTRRTTCKVFKIVTLGRRRSTYMLFYVALHAPDDFNKPSGNVIYFGHLPDNVFVQWCSRVLLKERRKFLAHCARSDSQSWLLLEH